MFVQINLVNGDTITDKMGKGETFSEYAKRKLDSAKMNGGFIFFQNTLVNPAHIVSMKPKR